MSGKKWTPYQIEKLKELYPTCENAEDLVTVIGRNLGSIYNKAFSLGLKKLINKGYNNLAKEGTGHRFKKGFTPWNKGMKGLQIGGIETRLKKGDIPTNIKYWGKPYLNTSSRKNGQVCKYWLIQELGSGKRQLYNRYLWEQHYGEIPKDHIVYYIKNIDEVNPPTIEDLGIMHKSENMDRNSIHRYPPELKQSIRLINKLKKQINETD